MVFVSRTRAAGALKRFSCGHVIINNIKHKMDGVRIEYQGGMSTKEVIKNNK